MNVQLVRSISILLIGVLLVTLGYQAINILIIAVGILFMIPGFYSLFTYFRHRHSHPMFPFAALGSFLLGFWLVLSPSFFVGIFMYVLGAVLVVLGIHQLATLSTSRHIVPVPGGLYVFPIAVLLMGLFIFFNPFEAASLPFIVIGIGCLVSSLSDIIQLIRMGKHRSTDLRNIEIEDAEVVE